MNRRNFLLGVSLLALPRVSFGAFRFVGSRPGGRYMVSRLVWSEIRPLRIHRPMDIGRRYLSACSGQPGPVALFRDTFLHPAPCLQTSDFAAIRAAFRLKREHDFRLGDVVIIDGWILARSEASLCALGCLTPPFAA